jgi:hypothetical protein
VLHGLPIGSNRGGSIGNGGNGNGVIGSLGNGSNGNGVIGSNGNGVRGMYRPYLDNFRSYAVSTVRNCDVFVCRSIKTIVCGKSR